jgi:hypothetical protein
MGRATGWLCIPSKSQRSDNQLRVFLTLPYYTLHCLLHFPRRSPVGIPKNNVDYSKEDKQTRRVSGFIIIPFFVLVHTSHCTFHTLIALPLEIHRLRERSSNDKDRSCDTTPPRIYISYSKYNTGYPFTALLRCFVDIFLGNLDYALLLGYHMDNSGYRTMMVSFSDIITCPPRYIISLFNFKPERLPSIS